ncbi:lipooligosaccharide phosphoethanolamine transferase [Allohahella marinimesophila]|uniref:Lipooligosaccharide phosphoethanolamine transferase n=2 Tax=Allohahella marinimesophila TaxID=1054972 RepID=A0ABP7P8T2_9GAMM
MVGLAILTTILLLADDFLQQLYTANNRAELELSYVFVLWVISLCLWLCGRPWFVNLILALFAFMQLLQISHISYIGDPLTAIDISKLFSERHEIGVAINSTFKDHWPALLAWGIPYAFLFGVYNWGIRHFRIQRSWIPLIIVVLILGSKPNRAITRDMLAFMPGAARSSLHNSINVFSYYAVRMMGRDKTVEGPDYAPYTISRTEPVDPPENIWILMPDSVRSDRLGIGGYHRDTTPHLSALWARGELQAAQGIAASVATGSSLPLFMNVIAEPGNFQALEDRTANMFRLAQEAGYKTFWISTQESKMMNGIGSRYIDVHITEEDNPIDLNMKGDKAVLDWLKTQTWGERNFVVINLRSTHSPYEEAYAAEDEDFARWPDGAEVDYDTRMSNAYDNAVVYLDEILASSIEFLSDNFDGDHLWLFTSDHGQELGEDKLWGHNRLTANVAGVPIVMHQKHDDDSAIRYRLPDAQFISHYEIGQWLLGTMGYELDNPNQQQSVHYFQGEKLHEDNLYMRVVENENSLVFCRPTLVSRHARNEACRPDFTMQALPWGDIRLVDSDRTAIEGKKVLIR